MINEKIIQDDITALETAHTAMVTEARTLNQQAQQIQQRLAQMDKDSNANRNQVLALKRVLQNSSGTEKNENSIRKEPDQFNLPGVIYDEAPEGWSREEAERNGFMYDINTDRLLRASQLKREKQAPPRGANEDMRTASLQAERDEADMRVPARKHNGNV